MKQGFFKFRTYIFTRAFTIEDKPKFVRIKPDLDTLLSVLEEQITGITFYIKSEFKRIENEYKYRCMTDNLKQKIDYEISDVLKIQYDIAPGVEANQHMVLLDVYFRKGGSPQLEIKVYT